MWVKTVISACGMGERGERRKRGEEKEGRRERGEKRKRGEEKEGRDKRTK